MTKFCRMAATDYIELEKMCNDGRDLQVIPWEKQKQFSLGFHYNMPFEHAKEIKRFGAAVIVMAFDEPG